MKGELSISATEAARRSGVSEGFIRQLVEEHKIFGMRIAEVRVSPDSIEEIKRLAFLEHGVQLGPGTAQPGEPGFLAVRTRGVDGVGSVHGRVIG